jgi:hypothetical protein
MRDCGRFAPIPLPKLADWNSLGPLRARARSVSPREIQHKVRFFHLRIRPLPIIQWSLQAIDTTTNPCSFDRLFIP